MKKPEEPEESDLFTLSLDNSNFPCLRDSGQIYIDKTDQIHRLVTSGSRYYFTRPRGFGKSLLISTLECLFKNEKQYFEGLDIERLPLKFENLKVVSLDFALTSNFKSEAEFTNLLEGLICHCFSEIGFKADKNSGIPIMDQWVRWLSVLPRQSTVILIDNCDAPFAACLCKPEFKEFVTSKLSAFYQLLNANDKIMKFVWVSGNSNVGRRCIFDAYKKLKDISIGEEYATLLGFTHEEIGKYQVFFPSLKAPNSNYCSPAEVVSSLTKAYGGYCFDDKTYQTVIDPWSLLKSLSSLDPLMPYYRPLSFKRLSWLESYTLSLPLTDIPEEDQDINLFDFQLTDTFEHGRFSELSLLTQLGYLTIKRHHDAILTVGYPNYGAYDFLRYWKKNRQGPSINE